jgi:hypothetical protein
MWLLLDRVAIVLDAHTSLAEGGAWEVYTLAEDVRRARAADPPTDGQGPSIGAISCTTLHPCRDGAGGGNARAGPGPRRKCMTVFEEVSLGFS